MAMVNSSDLDNLDIATLCIHTLRNKRINFYGPIINTMREKLILLDHMLLIHIIYSFLLYDIILFIKRIFICFN